MPAEIISIVITDMYEFEKTMGEIWSHIFSGKSVPAKLIIKVSELVGDEKDLKTIEYNNHINKIADEAVEYFKTKKGYDFNGEYQLPTIEYKDFKPPPSLVKKGKNKYSLHEMCLYALLSLKDINKDNKGVAIRHIYKSLLQYSTRFNKKHKLLLNHYKLTVIATYLANSFGIINPPIQKIGNVKLAKAGAYDTDRLNK